MRKIIIAVSIFAAVLGFGTFASAQSKTRKAKKTTVRKTTAAKTTPVKNSASPVPGGAAEETAVKKNERPPADKNIPADGAGSPDTGDKIAPQKKPNARPGETPRAAAPVYFYTFSQPEFLVSKILIEHDEAGAGKISFQKRDFGEFITDPIQLSPAALERVKIAFAALDFLNSKETYQSPERSYAHLGTMTVAEKKDGRARTAEFNWTENKDAKTLADEYRRVGQQFVWIFDMSVARQNQQLETPSLMDALDSMIKRNEISDAAQMIPLLTELSTDERLPLIARNHATRIVKEIEKKAEK